MNDNRICPLVSVHIHIQIPVFAQMSHRHFQGGRRRRNLEEEWREERRERERDHKN